MKQRIMSLAFLAALLLSELQLTAHPLLIVGTVAGLHDSQLEVKTDEGDTLSVILKESTVIQQGEKRVDATELKTGLRVEVHALDDESYPIVAYLVTIVPSDKSPAK